ncbi:MAG TPA: DUF4190 domain-containing protein [Phycisphaerales bacterium]|nr:DUF4190 domain-containing protein [Phycisphaerales bacterium]
MQRKKLNPWSMVAMLCAVGMCPLFSIASILLGIRALVDIKAKGDSRGVRLAWAAILVGSLVTGLWGGGMLWWNINVRSNIEQGPVTAIMHAQANDLESFESAFIVVQPHESAEQFINELQGRYGTLQSGGLNQQITEMPVDGGKLFFGMVPIEAELSYLLQFENGREVHLVGKFTLFRTIDGSSKFTNRFSWIRIEDKELGDLVYPVPVEESELHEQ